jgi:hypothetical protein
VFRTSLRGRHYLLGQIDAKNLLDTAYINTFFEQPDRVIGLDGKVGIAMIYWCLRTFCKALWSTG